MLKSQEASSPTLTGWLFRDLCIGLVLMLLVTTGHIWHAASANWFSAVYLGVIGFTACYAICYIVHEWGHYAGAKLAGINMPLAPYKGPVLGRFVLEDYDRRQYLWLSWGGDLAHVGVTIAALTFYFATDLGLAAGALAVGGLAFTSQALLVDQPIIWRVTRGADIQTTANAGTTREIILKKTWQSWLPLTFAVAAFSYLY